MIKYRSKLTNLATNKHAENFEQADSSPEFRKLEPMLPFQILEKHWFFKFKIKQRE